MEKKFKLQPPLMPNFINYDTGVVGKKQDGVSFNNKIPITSLSKEEALEYAELMKTTFLNHYETAISNSKV